jgi:hypothetical protein
MKGLFQKLKNKGKKGSDAEADKLKDQVEAEHKKLQKASKKTLESAGLSKSAAHDEAETYDNIPDSEGGAYQVYEVSKV